MADRFWKLANLFLKTRCGRVGLAVYIALCGGVWLVYDLAPGHERLRADEATGMAVVVFVIVWLGVLLCEWWEKRRSLSRE